MAYVETAELKQQKAIHIPGTSSQQKHPKQRITIDRLDCLAMEQ